MSDSHHAPVHGRTNWKRFGLAAGVVTTMTAAVLVMISQGALAAGFVVSGQQFKVSADRLYAEGFTNYGAVDARYGTRPGQSVGEPVAVASMRYAELNNMCQSVLTKLPIVGDVSLKLTAGKDKAVTANNLFVDMTKMDGDATFTNIEIGRDASDLKKGPGQGMQGLFGQQADKVEILNLKQVAWATTAGQFKLNGLHLEVKLGDEECFQDVPAS